MRVLFIEVDSEREWAVAALGPSFITAFLRQQGHEVHFLRVPLDMSVDDVVARIADIDPGLLAVSLTTRQWQRARRLMGMVRQRIDTPVVTGGLHPTFAPEDVLASPGFDYVCLGEGEEATLELVSALEAGSPTDDIQEHVGTGRQATRASTPVRAARRDAVHGARHARRARGGGAHVHAARLPFPMHLLRRAAI